MGAPAMDGAAKGAPASFGAPAASDTPVSSGALAPSGAPVPSGTPVPSEGSGSPRPHPYPQLLLDNQLCFPLYACAKEVVRRYTPLLDELGITYTQYIALMVLWEREQASVRELGRRLYLDSGTLTPLLKKMEAKGLVTRRRSEEDERVVVVALTDAGRALQEQAASVPERLGACLNVEVEDAMELRRLLRKVLGQIEGE